MAGVDVKVHPTSSFGWRPLDQLVGVVGIRATDQTGQLTDEPLYGLSFVDPDGETHVYVFTDEARVNLVERLTGGIVIANGVPEH